eukprot:g6567.t1
MASVDGLRLVTLVLCLARHTRASIFAVDYNPCYRCSSTLSEGYMWSSLHGPFDSLCGMLPALCDGLSLNGLSTITAQLNVTQRASLSGNLRVATAFYHLADGVGHAQSMPSICGEGAHAEAALRQAMAALGAEALEHSVQLMDFGDASFGTDGELALNGTGAVATVAPLSYTVRRRGRQYLRVEMCGEYGDKDLRVAGAVAFRNPYGFLPAVTFGLLPFHLALLAGLLLLGFRYCSQLARNRAHALPLHRAIGAVLAVSLVESTLWCAGFTDINSKGTPNCCPYPPLLVAAVCTQMVRKTLSRVLLLSVCLGVGMLFDSLRRGTSLCIGALAAFYFAAGLTAKLRTITMTGLEAEAAGAGAAGRDPFGDMEWGANLLFILWIFAALDAITSDLAVSNQSHKLGMYKQLTCILGAFTLLFSALTFLFIAISRRWIAMPWEWVWAFVGLGVSDDGAFWHLLDFALLATYCVVWRPSSSASQYSWSVELPRSAEAADALEAGIEMATQGGEVLGEAMTGVSVLSEAGGPQLDLDAEADFDFDLDDLGAGVPREPGGSGGPGESRGAGIGTGAGKGWAGVGDAADARVDLSDLDLDATVVDRDLE